MVPKFTVVAVFFHGGLFFLALTGATILDLLWSKRAVSRRARKKRMPGTSHGTPVSAMSATVPSVHFLGTTDLLQGVSWCIKQLLCWWKLDQINEKLHDTSIRQFFLSFRYKWTKTILNHTTAMLQYLCYIVTHISIVRDWTSHLMIGAISYEVQHHTGLPLMLLKRTDVTVMYKHIWGEIQHFIDLRSSLTLSTWVCRAAGLS